MPTPKPKTTSSQCNPATSGNGQHQKPKHAGGRPPGYTTDLADEICRRISAGGSIYEIDRDPKMPCSQTIYAWLMKHEEFFTNYARAIQIRTDKRIEENDILARAPAKSLTDVAQLRVLIDSRHWDAARLNPKKYGDKLTLAGDKDNPLTMIVSTAVAARARLELIANRLEPGALPESVKLVADNTDNSHFEADKEDEIT